MANTGTLSLALIILIPWIWRHYSGKKKIAANQTLQQDNKRSNKQNSLSRLPLPITRPSNVLITLAALTIFAYHLSALTLQSRMAMQTDLFLLLNRSVNTSAAILKSELQTFPKFQFGWRTSWTEDGLNSLIQRLGSWDGRKLHLLIGIDPFISCSFCTSSQDYIYYSLATRLTQYAVDMFLLGIITMRFDSLNTFDEIVQLLFHSFQGKGLSNYPSLPPSNDAMKLRPHRYQWRSRIKFIFIFFALCEIAVLSGFYDFGVRQGRISHWYANRNIIWHSIMLVLSIFTTFGPAQPHIPALLQIVHSLDAQQHISHDIRANLQAANLTQQILWHEPELRDQIIASSSNIRKDDTDETVNRFQKFAKTARVDVNTLQLQANQAAKQIWENSNQIWHQQK